MDENEIMNNESDGSVAGFDARIYYNKILGILIYECYRLLQSSSVSSGLTKDAYITQQLLNNLNNGYSLTKKLLKKDDRELIEKSIDEMLLQLRRLYQEKIPSNRSGIQAKLYQTRFDALTAFISGLHAIGLLIPHYEDTDNEMSADDWLRDMGL